jgi:uncharacterized protein
MRLTFFIFTGYINPKSVRAAFIVPLFVISSQVLFSQTYTIQSVPNTKLETGSYVSNPDNIIAPQTVSQIDSVLTELENKTSAQVAVVLLTSIGEVDPFDFSQELFDEWKIGTRNDNGLLILFVMDQREIRFHTGFGIEGVLPDATCKRIQTEKMVPYFKNEDYDEGILQGIAAVSDILSKPDGEEAVVTAEEYVPLYGFTTWVILLWIIIILIVYVVKSKRKSFVTNPANSAIPQPRFTAGGWIFWYLFVPVTLMIALSISDSAPFFFAGMYAYTGGSLLIRRKLMDRQAVHWLLKKDYQAVYNFYQQQRGLFSAMRFLFPIPFAFLYGAYKKRMLFFRNHPRDCKQCGKPLFKLDELADDAFLTKGQLAEEALKSVDYDIWKCASCNAADKLTYINPSSKYAECPKCKTRAYIMVSDSVITSATESREGIGEKIHACKFCGERNVDRYTIAKVQRSSSSSSSSGSSGGSWGGGSSGGGGASSRW